MKKALGTLGLMFAAGHDRERAPLRHRWAGFVFKRFPGQITCQQFESFLMDYYEGELPETERALFERHLSLCPQCRDSYLGYRKSIEMGQRLFADQSAPLPDDVPDHIVDAVVSVLKTR